MNNLQHIRSMAELILKQVDELEGTPAYSIPAYSLSKRQDPKFQVGDKVIWATRWGCYFKEHTVTRVTQNETLGDTGTIRYTYDIIRFDGCQLSYGPVPEDQLSPYVEPNAKKLDWHRGPPPHIGWWQASFGRQETSWRWWDGEMWSTIAAHPDWDWATVEETLDNRRTLGLDKNDPHPMEWTHYWPENARVPRINPELHTAANKHVAQYGDTKWVFDPRDGDIWQYWS